MYREGRVEPSLGGRGWGECKAPILALIFRRFLPYYDTLDFFVLGCILKRYELHLLDKTVILTY